MSASVGIPGINTRPAPCAWPCTRCQTGGCSSRDSSHVVICEISASCDVDSLREQRHVLVHGATDGTVTVAAGLDPERQARLRERCRELLPEPPFVLTSSAWAARALV